MLLAWASWRLSCGVAEWRRWFGLRTGSVVGGLPGFGDIPSVYWQWHLHTCCLHRCMKGKLSPESNCAGVHHKHMYFLPASIFLNVREVPVTYNHITHVRGLKFFGSIASVSLLKANRVSAKPNKIRVFNSQICVKSKRITILCAAWNLLTHKKITFKKFNQNH